MVGKFFPMPRFSIYNIIDITITLYSSLPDEYVNGVMNI